MPAPRPAFLRALTTLTAVLWLLTGATAQEPTPAPDPADPRIDAVTGRDTRVWPPDILFDHVHVRLEMVVPDMSTPAFSCVQTLTLEPIALPRALITLDAGRGLTFSAAEVDGRAVRFEHDREAERLTVRFASSIPAGLRFDLRLVYTADKPGGRGSGMTFSRDDPRTPEIDYMFHVQGQPECNHFWFACHDFPNERLTSEIIITLPAPYQAVSNGRLLSVKHDPAAFVPPPANAATPEATDTPGGEPAPPAVDAPSAQPPSGTITYHWLQDKPHAAYLITLVAGRFDMVELGGPDSPVPGLSMPVYGPLGSGGALLETFGNTPEMVAHFAQLFDYPYPWDQYAQVMCRNFAAGAMENTSCSTFNGSFVRGRRGSQDPIIAHELVHQWFGDLVGYRSWEHLWLGEGWATLGEALWAEHVQGEDGYQRAILADMGAERTRSSRRYAPRHTALVSHRYVDADSRFTSGDNVYQKGGAVLHMLRERLGDEIFWKGARLFLKRHAFEQVETDDFRLAMEEVSGQSLERFFDQWCRRPGMPVLELDYSWRDGQDGAPGELTVTVEQMQRIDGDNPAWAFELPVFASFPEGSPTDGSFVFLLCDSRSTTMSFPLAQRPKSISIDPYLTVLSRRKVRQGLDAALHQLRHGPTLAARVQAIDTLSDRPGLASLAALASLGVHGLTTDPAHPERWLARQSWAAASEMAASIPSHFARALREQTAALARTPRRDVATLPTH